MAAVTGHKSAVFQDGYNLSAYFNQLDNEMNAKELDTTAFGATARTRIGGIKDGSASMSGMFDSGTNAVDQLLAAGVGNDTGRIMTLTIGASTAGARARLFKTKPNNYQIGQPADDLITVQADLELDGGILAGDLISALATQTLAVFTGASVDCGVSTADGGFIHLHICAASTAITVDSIVVQDSADGSTWAHLATVCSAVAATTGATRYEIPETTQIDRYLRTVSTLTGSDATNTLRYAVAVGRR